MVSVAMILFAFASGGLFMMALDGDNPEPRVFLVLAALAAALAVVFGIIANL